MPFDWLPVAVLLGAALLAGLRPIASDGLWWDLARGRAVTEGAIAPSSSLLTLDEAAEADWLSGLPSYLLYAFLGSPALMACRVFVACAFVLGVRWQVRRESAQSSLPYLLLLAVCGLVMCEPSFDAGPALFNVLAVVVACVFAPRVIAIQKPWSASLFVILASAVAANLAPRVALALLVFWIALGGQLAAGRCKSGRFAALLATAALLGCCLTPRGLFSIRDSVLVSCPWLAAESWALQETVWRPLAVTNGSPLGVLPPMLFVAASVVFVVVAIRSRRTLDFVACAAMQFVAWTSTDNLPIAGAWLVFSLASQSGGADVTFLRPMLSGRTARVMTVAAACWIALVAFPIGEMGCGIDSRLDYRLVQLALQEEDGRFREGLTGSAFCDDERSAGMLSWLRPGTLRAQDAPRRALLHGRLAAHKLLLEDLRQQRKHSYWRTDETQGGWWLPLAGRDTILLLIAAEDAVAIGGLEPTIWKPLALDAPVLPFGQAGDPVMNGRIVHVLGERATVETGRWVYSSPLTTGSHFDRDRFGFRPEVGTSELALRQAVVFRAMGLHRAASKSLAYAVRRWRDDELRAEFARNQRELAYQEFLWAGHVSEFRQLALFQASRRAGGDLPLGKELAHPATADAVMLQAAASYASGELERASLQLAASTNEDLYAAACLSLELGRPDVALDYLQQVADDPEPSPIQRLAKRLREEIAP